MNSTVINLILCGILFLFLLFGFLWGIKRGLKRTAIRGGWLFLTIVLVALLSGVITKAIVNSNLLSLFDVSYDGVKVNTIGEYVQLYAEDLGVSAQNSKSVVELVVALAGLFINSLIFLILFWVLKLLLTPFYWLVCRLVLKDRKKEQQTVMGKDGKQKVVKKRIKVKKQRWWGGLVGVAVGALVCIATLTPVVGYLNLVKQIEEESIKEQGEGIVSSAIGEDNYQLLNDGYYNGAFNAIYTYTGMNFLSQSTFNLLSSTKVNGETIKLNKEGTQFVKIYSQAKTISEFDIDTCTQQEFSQFLTSLNSLIITAFDSSIVSSSSEVLASVGKDLLNKNLDIETMPTYTQSLLSSLINNVGELNANSIKEELINVVGVVQALNDCNILLPLIHGETDDMLSLLQDNLTKENTSNVINKLFSLKLVSNVAPQMANALLGFVAENIDESYTEVGTIENEALKNTLLNITSAAVETLKNIDLDSQYYIKSDGVASIGLFLEAALNNQLVTDNFEQDIISKVQTEAEKLINDINDLPDYISDFAKGVINNLDGVVNYETEFTYLQNCVNFVEEGLNDQDIEGDIDLSKLNFESMGKALDELEKSCLVVTPQSNLVKNLFVDLLSELKESEDLSTYTLNSIDIIKDNVLNIEEINWQQNLSTINNFVVKAKEIIEEGDFVNQLQTNNEKFVQLGVYLDQIKSAPIIANAGTNALVKDLLNMVASNFGDTEIELEIKKAVEQIDKNINTSINYSWETEFKHLCGLMSDDFEEVDIDNLPKIGEKFDNILNGYTEGTDVIVASKIIDKQVIDICIKAVLDEAFEVSEGAIKFDLNTIKDAFSDNNSADEVYTNNISSYAKEFEVFSKTYSLTYYDFTIYSDATEMGRIIDEIIELESVVITRDYINDYLIDVITDALPSNVNSQFNQVLYNIIGSNSGTPDDTSDDIISRLTTMTASYEVEFGYLNKIYVIFENQTSDVSIDSIVTKTTYPGESTAKNIGERLDEIKDSQVVGDCGIIILNIALDDYAIDNSKYTNIISEIKQNVNALNLSALNVYSTTFAEIVEFKNIIKQIKDNVEGITLTLDIAVLLENKLNDLQNLNIINYNATAQIAIYALTEIDATLSNVVQTTQVQNARTYISVYKNYYLPNVQNIVPYNSTTETTATVRVETVDQVISVNKPFTKVVALISA